MNKERFNGAVAIVTGGGTGIGAAIAKQLAWEGAAKVIVVGRRLEKLQAIVNEIGPDVCIPMAGDVSNEEDVKRIVNETVEKYGKVDCLANIAGISGPAVLAEDYTYEDFRRVYEINVFGTFLMMKYCIPVMKAQKKGAIVNTCSCSGMRGYDYEIGYGSSKFAVLGMTMNAAGENGRTGIRVNCFAPGWVDTPMLDGILANYDDVGASQDKNDLNNGTMDRPSTPEEMAEVACFLLSDEARYVNGANFVCDGGKTLQ